MFTQTKTHKYMSGTTLFKPCAARRFSLINKTTSKEKNKTRALHSHSDGGGLEVSDPAAPPRRASTQPASLRATTVKLSLVVTARLLKYQASAQTTQESATRSAHTHDVNLVAADVMSLF